VAVQFATDPAAALSAFRLAERVGINQAARELGTVAATLNRAWAKHGMGRPTSPAQRPPTPKPVADRAVPAAQRAFLRLNPSFARPAGLPAAKQLARARDREQLEAVGVRPVQAARAENSDHAGRRTWAVIARARAARDRSAGRSAGRPGGMPGDRPAGRSGERSADPTGDGPAGRIGDRPPDRPSRSRPRPGALTGRPSRAVWRRHLRGGAAIIVGGAVLMRYGAVPADLVGQVGGDLGCQQRPDALLQRRV